MADVPGRGGDDEAQVTYTVKELLQGIKGSVDQLNGKMDAKADKADMIQLAKVVDTHDDRITHVESRVTVVETQRETEAQVNDRHIKWWQWVVPTLIGIATIIIGVLGLIHTGTGK